MIEPPGTFGTPGADVRLDGEELRAVDAAERLAEVVDPRRVEVARPAPSTSIADLDHAHELHQVDHRLAQAVAAADEPLRRAPR